MKSSRKRKTKHLLEQNIHPNSAGIDIGADIIVVAIPQEKDDEEPVRTYGTFTSDLIDIRDWLLSHSISTVAMESTGVYWVALYEVLEESGIEVCLVNARHVKGVPGKKTDIIDAQWLQQLHRSGLLKASFRPRYEVVRLRELKRHRDVLTQDASRQLLQMQKSLTTMNLKIHQVFSDLDGVTGMRILEAILDGEKDPHKLWEMRCAGVKAKKAVFLQAMEGSYNEQQLFILKHHHRMWKSLKSMIIEADGEIEVVMKQLEPPGVEGELEPTKKHRIKVKGAPKFDVFTRAYNCYGVDLSTIDGVSSGFLSVLMSEVGNRDDLLKNFKSAKAFCSWLGLCPDNRVSGGKILKSKTRPVVNRLATAFRLCVFGVGHAKNEMGQYARRMKGKLGKAEGIVAVAHKIARLVYSMIQHQKPYDAKLAFKETSYGRSRKLKALKKLAEELKIELAPHATPQA